MRPAGRTAFAMLLVAHGLAHTLAGTRITDVFGGRAGTGTALIVATVLWVGASAGSMSAALGLLGMRWFNRQVRLFGLGAAFCSLLLLTLFWNSPWIIPGALLDFLMIGVLSGRDTPVPGQRHRLLKTLTSGLQIYLLLLIAFRPVTLRWGNDEALLLRGLPADDLTPQPVYRIQHSVVIGRPPAAVWPWLVQIGQGRGGFYSYTWLENAVGARITNTQTINPAWQKLDPGDSIFGTPPDYLGTGRRFGWRVGAVQPRRLLYLERWGAFVLEPLGIDSTRLIVRSQGNAGDGLWALLLAPFNLAVFEPAHFIMERKMLLTIKQRAESEPLASFD